MGQCHAIRIIYTASSTDGSFKNGELNPLAKKKAPLYRGALVSFVWINLCVSVYALLCLCIPCLSCHARHNYVFTMLVAPISKCKWS